MPREITVPRIGMTALVMAMTAGQASAAMAPGSAHGTLNFNGHDIELRYAYAQPRDDRQWPIEVALTDRPLRSDILDGEKPLEDVARQSDTSGIRFFMKEDRPTILSISTSSWGGFGCGGTCDELLDFQRSGSAEGQVAGRLASKRMIVFSPDRKASFQVEFAAAIRGPAAAPKGDAAQEAARRMLVEKGYRFTKGDFFKAAFSWNQEAVTLFLRGGMPPDTPSPESGYSLLMSLLGGNDDCQDREQAALIPILLQAGADPNQLEEGGLPRMSTPLGRAYPCPNRMEMLIKAGARVDAPAQRPSLGPLTVGRLLMEEAIADDNAVVVSVLIRNGFDVKSKGAELLEQASGKPLIEQLLVAAGATRQAPARRRRPRARSR